MTPKQRKHFEFVRDEMHGEQKQDATACTEMQCPICGDMAIPTPQRNQERVAKTHENVHEPYAYEIQGDSFTLVYADAVHKYKMVSEDAITEILYTVPQPKQEHGEPVAITTGMALAFHRALSDGPISKDEAEEIKRGLEAAFAHITTPQQRDSLAEPRTWVGLTDEDVLQLIGGVRPAKMVRAVEAKLKEKNCGTR